MRNVPWAKVLALLLAAFFVFGGFSNIFISAENAAGYIRWGYPAWFHYVTGLLELTTAALLAFGRTRPLGAALGGAVMLAAAATVFLHGEYLHALAPLVVLALLALVLWTMTRRRALA